MNLKKITSLLFSSLLLLTNHSTLFSRGFNVTGTVTDVSGQPVSYVLVTFINESDTTIVFEITTYKTGLYIIYFDVETSVKDKSKEALPKDFKLLQNYPNPLNSNTTIPFELRKSGFSNISIFNIVGQQVRTLLDGYQNKGRHQIIWDGLDENGQRCPSGIYICHMMVRGKIQSQKMLLLEGNSPGYVKTGAGSHVKPVLSKITAGHYYSVFITGLKIESYRQTGILIDRDMQLDFVVENQRTGEVTDIDGNTYRTVKIGNQWWMAENLKVTRYCNGDSIPHVTDNKAWQNSRSTGAYCNYDNDENNVATYGRLFNWFAVNDSRNIAPAGWHVPTKAEYDTLIDYIGGVDIAGGKMKESGLAHWKNPNTFANNESGFSGLPGGYRGDDGFYGMGFYATFWSSSKRSFGDAWCRWLDYNSAAAHRYGNSKLSGFSVRCVQD